MVRRVREGLNKGHHHHHHTHHNQTMEKDSNSSAKESKEGSKNLFQHGVLPGTHFVCVNRDSANVSPQRDYKISTQTCL